MIVSKGKVNADVWIFIIAPRIGPIGLDDARKVVILIVAWSPCIGNGIGERGHYTSAFKSA
jgi:hypothetical protein